MCENEAAEMDAPLKPLKDWELGLVAERLPAFEFNQIAITYLGMTKIKLDQCKKDYPDNCVTQMTNALISWRNQQPEAASRLLLNYQLSRAADAGLVDKISFQFLLSGEEDKHHPTWTRSRFQGVHSALNLEANWYLNMAFLYIALTIIVSKFSFQVQDTEGYMVKGIKAAKVIIPIITTVTVTVSCILQYMPHVKQQVLRTLCKLLSILTLIMALVLTGLDSCLRVPNATAFHLHLNTTANNLWEDTFLVQNETFIQNVCKLKTASGWQNYSDWASTIDMIANSCLSYENNKTDIGHLQKGGFTLSFESSVVQPSLDVFWIRVAVLVVCILVIIYYLIRVMIVELKMYKWERTLASILDMFSFLVDWLKPQRKGVAENKIETPTGNDEVANDLVNENVAYVDIEHREDQLEKTEEIWI